MKIAGLTVSVDGDTKPLEESLQRGKATAAKGGKDMADAIGQGLSSVKDHFLGVEKETESWLSRHKGLMATAAAVTAGMWAYGNQDVVKGYWDKANDITGQAVDGMKGKLSDLGDQAAKVAQDMGDRFGKAGDEIGRYAVSSGLSAMGDAFLKLGESVTQAGAELERISNFTGQSIKTLSELKDLAGQTGVSFSDLTSSFQALDSAAQGQSDAAKMSAAQMEAWGISTTDANGVAKTSEQLWVELSQRVQDFSKSGQDATKVTEALKNILGSIDKDKLDLLNEGGDVAQARLAEAARLRTIYTDQMVADLNRIQKERAVEANEEKAWADRKNVLWAQLGIDFKNIARDVEWGQTSFVEGVQKAWTSIGDFVGKYVDYLIEKYQAFLQFLDKGAKALGINLPGLSTAAAQGPGQNPVIPALEGRNADGSPKPPSQTPGSVKPPPPLSPSKTGGSDNLQLEEYVKQLSNKAMGAQDSLLGDKYGAEGQKALETYRAELEKLDKDIGKFTGSNKDALEASGKYWANYALGIAQAKVALDRYNDSMKFWADTLKTMGTLTGSPEKSFGGEAMGIDQSTQATQRNLDSSAAYQAKKIWDDAVEAAKKDGADVDAIWGSVNDKWLANEQEHLDQSTANNDAASAKKTDALYKAYGDAATLLDGYWPNEMAKIDNFLADLNKRGVDQQNIHAVAAQKYDELNKKTLESRIKYEDDFGSYLKDRLSLDYGLYKDALTKQQDLWGHYYDAIKKGMDAVENAIGTGIGNSLGDAMSGKFKGIQAYVDSLLSSLKSTFASFLGDLAKIAVRNYITVPIVGQIMGTTGSFAGDGTGASSGAGSSSSSSSSFSLSGLSQTAGIGSGVYTLSGGSAGGLIGSANAWGQSTLGIGAAAQPAIMSEGNVIAPAVASTGVGTALGAGAMGAGIGYMAGSVLRPDNPSTSYVAAGAGLVAGGIAGMAGLGMLASTGIGAAVAIPVAVGMALLTPDTVTTSATGGNGITINMQSAGSTGVVGYDAYRQTTEGLGGSSNTTHFKGYTAADPALQKAWDTGMDTNTNAMEGNLKALNMGTSALKNFTFPMNFDVDSEHLQQILSNLNTAMAENSITAAGLKDRFDAVALSGEAYGDELTRLGTAMTDMTNVAVGTGVNLENFSQSMDTVGRAGWMYQMEQAVGGLTNLTSAMSALGTYGYTTGEQMTNTLNSQAEAADKAIATIGDSSVTINNFWAKFRAAMEAGMDPNQMTAWSAASQYMSVWQKTVNTLQATALQSQITGLQTQLATAQQLQQTWTGIANSMSTFASSLLQDSSLSPLSPKDKLTAAQSLYSSDLAKAQAGDTTALQAIQNDGKSYLSAALAYYGASAQYYSTFSQVYGDVQGLTSYAAQQANAATQQVADLTTQIAQNQAQLDALNNINTGLGDVVNAVNNVSQAIGGAIATADAATKIATTATYVAPTTTSYTDAASTVDTALPDFSSHDADSVPAFAAGGLHKGGMRLVGEHGPELEVTGPARYFSASQTKSMLANQTQQQGTHARLEAIFNMLAHTHGTIKDAHGERVEQGDKLHRALTGLRKGMNTARATA